jgi:hypothetical protein
MLDRRFSNHGALAAVLLAGALLLGASGALAQTTADEPDSPIVVYTLFDLNGSITRSWDEGETWEALTPAMLTEEDYPIGQLLARRAMGTDAGTASATLTASPNPTSGAVRISYRVPREAKVTITAYDASGVPVLRSTVDRAAGDHTAELDLSGLASGIYRFRVSTVEGVIGEATIVMTR